MFIGTIRPVDGFERVTSQQLALYAVLLEAFRHGEELHGYELKQRAKITGPSTYRILDRLQDHHLVDSRWEELPPDEGRPRRRYYMLNPAGAASVRAILADRRPQVLAELGKPQRKPSRTARPSLGGLIQAITNTAGGTR
jgi:PadR family transcriptional regulator PadR